MNPTNPNQNNPSPPFGKTTPLPDPADLSNPSLNPPSTSQGNLPVQSFGSLQEGSPVTSAQSTIRTGTESIFTSISPVPGFNQQLTPPLENNPSVFSSPASGINSITSPPDLSQQTNVNLQLPSSNQDMNTPQTPTSNPSFNWLPSPATTQSQLLGVLNPGSNENQTNQAPNSTTQDLYNQTLAPQTPEQPTIVSQPVSPLANSNEPAPTDLSHLVETGNKPPIYIPPLSQPETLVVPPNNTAAQIPNVPTQGANHGIPKWLIAVGIALLLAVIATSGYFILGIGRTFETGPVNEQGNPLPENLPPTEVSVVNQPTQVPSSGFGELSGGGGLPTPTQSTTSAADLLKQRRNQQ